MASLLDNISGIFGNDPNDGTNALMRFGQELQMGGAPNQLPSAIQEYAYFSKLPPEQQQQYLLVKRANPLLNQGNQFGAYNPVSGAVTPVAPINPKVSEMPDFQQQVKRQEAVGAAIGAAEGAKEKQVIQAPQVIDTIAEAEKLLPQATSGRLENVASSAKKFAGRSDANTQADARLEVISSDLLKNIPRFEGPQSDKDVAEYKRAAGDIANPNKSVGDRMVALQQIKDKALKAYGGPSVGAAGKKVRVQAPDGTTGSIDASELENAIANGWKQL